MSNMCTERPVTEAPRAAAWHEIRIVYAQEHGGARKGNAGIRVIMVKEYLGMF
jgi:hypothetical protein